MIIYRGFALHTEDDPQPWGDAEAEHFKAIIDRVLDGNHNELSGIQGGDVDDYYHITLDELNRLKTIVDRPSKGSIGSIQVAGADGSFADGGIKIHDNLQSQAIGLEGKSTTLNFGDDDSIALFGGSGSAVICQDDGGIDIHSSVDKDVNIDSSGTGNVKLSAFGTGSVTVNKLAVLPEEVPQFSQIGTPVREIIAGNNITVDSSDPERPVVSSIDTDTGIQEIVAGANISVDNTDPERPIVSATQQELSTDNVINDSTIIGDSLTEVLELLKGENEHIPFGNASGGYTARNLQLMIDDLNDYGFTGNFEILNFGTAMNTLNRGFPAIRLIPLGTPPTQSSSWTAWGINTLATTRTMGLGATAPDVANSSVGTSDGRLRSKLTFKEFTAPNNFNYTENRAEFGDSFIQFFKGKAVNSETVVEALAYYQVLKDDGDIESYADFENGISSGVQRIGANQKVVMYCDSELTGFEWELWNNSANARVLAMKLTQRTLAGVEDRNLLELPNTTVSEIDSGSDESVLIKSWGKRARYQNFQACPPTLTNLDVNSLFLSEGVVTTTINTTGLRDGDYFDFACVGGANTITITLSSGSFSGSSVVTHGQGIVRFTWESAQNTLYRFSTNVNPVIQSGFFQQTFPFYNSTVEYGAIPAQNTHLFKLKASVAFSITKIRTWVSTGSSAIQVAVYSGTFNMLTREAFGTISLSSAGYNQVTLTGTANLVAGQEYFVALHVSFAQSGGNNTIAGINAGAVVLSTNLASANAVCFTKASGVDTIPSIITSGMVPMTNPAKIPYLEVIS